MADTTDAARYAKAMMNMQPGICETIEHKHGVYGYPPEIVSLVLNASAPVETLRAELEASRAKCALLAAEVEGLRSVLTEIVAWKLPPSGRSWPDTNAPMSYGVAFGSNGERDYFRDKARAVLSSAAAAPDQGEAG